MYLGNASTEWVSMRDLLTQQFEAVLCTLAACIDRCPRDSWNAPVGNLQFCQVAFHALFFADVYLGENLESLKGQAFHQEHQEQFADYEELEDRVQQATYSKPFLLAYLQQCRTKAAQVIASETSESLTRQPGFDWLKFSRGEVHVYNIRHLQHHVAQLSLRLRLDAEIDIPWIGSGWNDEALKEPSALSPAIMWSNYLSTLDDANSIAQRGYTAWHFCNNQQDADLLAQLVVEGKKRATCSSLWVYESQDEPLPKVGDHSVVTNWHGTAVCIICATSVNIVAYDQVDERFAAAEGEGDLSLAYWRKAHWDFFTVDLASIGKAPTEKMPLVCERFNVVYPPANALSVPPVPA